MQRAVPLKDTPALGIGSLLHHEPLTRVTDVLGLTREERA